MRDDFVDGFVDLNSLMREVERLRNKKLFVCVLGLEKGKAGMWARNLLTKAKPKEMRQIR